MEDWLKFGNKYKLKDMSVHSSKRKMCLGKYVSGIF